MRSTTVEKLAELQRNPGNVRNICILAHVDHGKTTLADALVASNGIISQRMAGKLRYMDSREDEQVRGITMKSSAISLHYQQETEEYLVNLIDSPGHVDFSSEVSTAVRLCDGAIVMVDVVEGVCPQTHAVLRQAWLENIKPILVLNKIDRLITELKMETLQAFIHLQQILEQVNLVTSELFTADVMSMQSSEDANGVTSDQQTHDWTEDADELEDRNIYFSPDQGNVVFASALDGWGFTIGQFAELYSKKLGISEAGLKRTLWGDYYLNMKTKRVTKGAQSKGKKPLFVQFVLENIWSVYDAVMVRRDKEMIEKIVKSLNLKIAVRDSRHADPRVQLTAITSQWLPVSKAVLSVVVEKLPSPLSILEDKVEKLMCSQAKRFDSLPEQTQKLKQDFLACSDKDDVPVIVFVSKMVPVEKKILPVNKQRQLTEEERQKRHEDARLRHAARLAGTPVGTEGELQGTSSTDNDDLPSKSADSETDNEDHVFVAFARVFSGTVRQGQKLYVLGPKHDPTKALEEVAAGGHVDSSVILEDLASDQHVTIVTVKNLYLFMGRELERLDAVPAGNVLGIGGLEDHILNSGTISSTVACPAFTDLYFDAFPILRVALETTHAGDMKHLIRGLKLLNQADPCVQMLVQETGELVIITAGEVHLRKCLDDLRDRYAKVEITASKPIVPFRETIIPPPKIDMVNESIQDLNQITRNERWKEFEEDEEVLEEGLVRIFTPSKNCMVQIRAKALPPQVTDILENNQFLIKTLDQYVSAQIAEKTKSRSNQRLELKDTVKEEIKEFREKLDKAFSDAGKKWKGFVDNIWAFGPRRVGPNLLINKVEGYDRISLWNCLEGENTSIKNSVRDCDYSVIWGFQLATLTGPLCDEPLRGVCFIVEKWEILTDSESDLRTSVPDIEISSHGLELNSPLQSLNSQLKNVTLEDVSTNEGQGQTESCDIQDQSESTGSRSCDTLETENEKSDQVPPIVSRRKRQRSCRVSESGSIHDLEVETLHDLDLNSDSDEESRSSKKKIESYGHVSGQLIGIVKDSCVKAFQTQPQRLMMAMYKCSVQCTTEALGKLYAVISKRHGRIIGDDMREGTQMFSIEAVIPVVESFGFSEDIRKKTSGLASPQLVFSHWEILDVDPYWVPRTEEEIMHYGEKADTENRALTYMNNVRDRKGLKVDKKIVEHAEKQRTLTKNK